MVYKGENKETVRSQCHINNTGLHKITQKLKEQKQTAVRFRLNNAIK
jgi:hypothetical protein